MYNLDIKFLRERRTEPADDIASSFVEKKETSLADKIPIAAGIIVALAAPAITFGYLRSVKAETATVEMAISQLESEIAELGNQNQKIEELNTQIQEVQQETAALVEVFNKIEPWPAILQEVSDRTPPGVLVESLQQSGSGDSIGLNIAGVALNYDSVNDFVLLLQRSPFFDRNGIRLNGASVANLGVQVENEEDLPDNASLEIPEGVKYTISAQLSNVPSSQLIKEIERKGSDGLVIRLKTLERKGVDLQ
jgi:type IV pilus assembly protein PilN